MVSKAIAAAAVAALSLGGYAAYAIATPALALALLPASDGAEPPAGTEPLAGPGLTLLEWEGYLRAGPADMLAHTKETEGLVAPLARMGFNLEVPEGTESLVFRLAWPAGTRMHLMVHGPHEAGMPTYMTEWPAEGEACLAVPGGEAAPGVWKVMAHGDRAARDLAFTIAVELVGPEGARVLDGAHGHALADDMEMEHRDAAPCAEG